MFASAKFDESPVTGFVEEEDGADAALVEEEECACDSPSSSPARSTDTPDTRDESGLLEVDDDDDDVVFACHIHPREKGEIIWEVEETPAAGIKGGDTPFPSRMTPALDEFLLSTKELALTRAVMAVSGGYNLTLFCGDPVVLLLMVVSVDLIIVPVPVPPPPPLPPLKVGDDDDDDDVGDD